MQRHGPRKACAVSMLLAAHPRLRLCWRSLPRLGAHPRLHLCWRPLPRLGAHPRPCQISLSALVVPRSRRRGPFRFFPWVVPPRGALPWPGCRGRLAPRLLAACRWVLGRFAPPSPGLGWAPRGRWVLPWAWRLGPRFRVRGARLHVLFRFRFSLYRPRDMLSTRRKGKERPGCLRQRSG